MSRTLHSLFAIVPLLLFFSVSVCAQTYTSSNSSASTSSSIRDIQKRMMQEGIKLPDSVIKKIDEKSIDFDKKSSLEESDSLAMPDSLDTLQSRTPQPVSDTSFYEHMIHGKVIDPDSVLSKIEIFGYSIFKQDPRSRINPSEQVSVPADYVTSPGDEIIITMWGRINEEHRLIVDRDGSVNIPRIGPVVVGGMPFKDMQVTISNRIQAIEGVQASISMGELRSVTIFVVGEVAKPGQYTVNALSNVTNALFAAGGVTKRGSLRTIELRRNGRLSATIDFYEFLLSGNNFSNLRLKAGDVIHVPVVKSMAAVAGNVRRSALYEFKGKTNIKEMIDLAGGFTPAAWINRIQVDRFQNNNHQVVLDLEAASPSVLPNFEVMDGDIIRVFQIVDRDKNAVYLSGNVKRPGKYEYKEGMSINKLITAYSDLKPETFLGYAVIHRLEPPKYKERIISFSLENVLDSTNGDGTLQLMPNDNIIVYHRDYFEPDRTVMISGAITNPGKYRLLDNMRVKDLILQAGGLTDAASIDRGELYSRGFDKDSVKTEKKPFCVQCAMKDDMSANLELKKLDHVYVREKRGWEEIRKVMLKGEIVFSGEYILLPGETLGNLISRAGGFTDEAYLDAAIFTRNSIKEMENKRNEEYVRTLESNIARLSAEMAAKERMEEAQYMLEYQLRLLERLRDFKPIGRVVVDLSEPRSYAHFSLEDGDTLYIPKTMNTVSVMGEVFNPSTFQLDQRHSNARNYLSLAGGMKENSDKRNVYIVRANGTVVSGKKNSIASYQMKPGDVVVVPQKIRYVSGYRVFLETIDAIYKVAMTAAVVITVINK